MTDHLAWQDKKTPNVPQVKTLAEKYLEEKRNAALGITPSNQFGSNTPIVNRPWFGGKSWGGRTTIRKHAARSR